VKVLAAGRVPVYLVSGDAAAYAEIRERLRAAVLPQGPAFWIRPGEEYHRLWYLQRAWPQVDGAVVTSPALAAAAKRLPVRAVRVPEVSGRRAEPAGEVGAWPEAVKRLDFGRGVNKRGAN
jgi:hypothetical protein